MIDLNIISFDVPFPANYGGVIDVFYKLEALHKQGIKIALHCFDYGRGQQEKLNEVAEEIHYYERKTSWVAAAFTHPYTVKSRENVELLKNLKSNSAPILFEGLQSCAFLNHPDLENRNKWVRTHNVEHDYYESLANYEGSKIKKMYYQKEARALEYFESNLKYANGLLCISPKDKIYFSKYEADIYYLPAFSKESNVLKNEVKEFALYHGNLSVEENQAAVEFLIGIFEILTYKFVIAGKNPTDKLKSKIKKYNNIELIANPSEDEMEDLLATAKVNCLPTFQATGIKLKLLSALKYGNEVLVNSAMVTETGLEEFCTIAEAELEWIEELEDLFEKEINLPEIEVRQKAVKKLFDNNLNAKQLVEWLGLAQ